MSATLKVTRTITGIAAIELHRGTFDLILDGNNVGPIEWHKTTETPIDAGQHTLRIRSGRYSSPSRTFSAADDEMVAFRCHGANLWFIWLASLAIPSLGVSLRRE